MAALIWPLLDKINRPTATQRRPTAAANQRLRRIPAMPWDDSDRPGNPVYGMVESDPTQWELAPWDFGLAAISRQSKRLVEFRTNPRALSFSTQVREPAVIRPAGIWQVFPPAPAPSAREKTSKIIWPLRTKLPQMIFAQQRPKYAGNLGIPSQPLLPWNFMTMPRNVSFGLVEGPNILVQQLKPQLKPTVVHARLPLPARIAMIGGVTRDSVGAILGSCVVELYETATDLPLQKTTSDATTGAFIFTAARYSPATHYIVAYKAGGTDVAGTSVNTITGT